MGKLLTKAKELARKDGYDNLYLSTREKGLYEKYGAVYMTTLRDNQGEESDVFRLETYGYYGREVTGIQARIPDYPGIVTPKDLYRALWPSGSGRPARPGCRRTGMKRTEPWGNAP